MAEEEEVGDKVEDAIVTAKNGDCEDGDGECQEDQNNEMIKWRGPFR